MGLIVIAGMLLASCQPQTLVVVTVIPGTPVVKTEAKTEIQIVTATPAPVARSNVLRINLGAYPDIIDPQKSSFVNEIAHLKLIYEGLTRFNEKLETVPAAAQKWEYNKDGTELTFTLRRGLKYSDGSVLNARRFAYSIKRNINPETAGERAALTDDIKGAPEWRNADLEKTKPEDLKKLETEVDKNIQALDLNGQPCKTGKDGYAQEDCLILKLTFSKPAPYFHTILGLWIAYPAKEENMAAGRNIWWTSTKYQIGNGPFIMKSMEPFIHSRFEPNPNYWGGQAPYAIEYSYITDSAQALRAYKNNEFDMIAPFAGDIESVKADPQLSKEALIFPGLCTFSVEFHQQKPPFDDANVRKAFAMALDRDAWAKDIYHGLGNPILTWIPNGYPGYQAGEKRWGYNPDEAKRALAASKYGSVDKLPSITATFGDTPGNRIRWEWLAKKWKEVLGVGVKLNPVETTTFAVLVKKVETAPQMFILGWCADYPDPQDWLSVYWRSDSEHAKEIGYSNADVDKLTKQADSTVDPKARLELYQKAQDAVVDSAPAAFLWNTVNSYLVKPWVKGIQVTPQDADWPGSQTPLSINVDTLMMP